MPASLTGKIPENPVAAYRLGVEVFTNSVEGVDTKLAVVNGYARILKETLSGITPDQVPAQTLGRLILCVEEITAASRRSSSIIKKYIRAGNTGNIIPSLDADGKPIASIHPSSVDYDHSRMPNDPEAISLQDYIK